MLVYHAVGSQIRAAASKLHPVPTRRLVDFGRFTLAPGEATAASFRISRDAFGITTAGGTPRVYAGEHALIFSRGVAGADQLVPIHIGAAA